MSKRLILAAHLIDPDRFYEALINAHRDLSEADSAAFNARLILVLANQVGDTDVLLEALEAAGLQLQAGHRLESSGTP